jgi:hypothetical protein
MDDVNGSPVPQLLSRDEIVVAAPHAQRVVDLVGADFAGVLEVNRALGLARVALVELETAAEKFETVVADAVASGALPTMRADTPLERILAGVRASFASRYAGWVPRMGKNRVMLLGGESLGISIPRDGGFPDERTPDGRALTPADVPDGATSPERKSAGDGVLVGLLDTAVPRGETLGGRLHKDSSRLDDSSTWVAAQGHGLFSAGLVHQHAPAAELLVRGVLAGRRTDATAWEVAVALVDLVHEAGRDLAVVNMSLGCFTEDGRPPLVLDTAASMVRDDVVLVAAAGNHGGNAAGGFPSPHAPLWPAALDGVVAVGGRVRDGNGWATADFTPRAPWVDLLADGSDVVSNFLDGEVAEAGDVVRYRGAARWTGCSMASASAAGRIAGLGRTVDEIRDGLQRVVAGSLTDAGLTVYEP